MAEFNPFLPQPNIPDWTNAPGRLIDGSGLGEIFGKVALSVSEQYGKAKEGKAANDLYQSADAAAEEGRTEALASAAGIPRDVAKAMDKAKLYKQAFESGKFSEAGFYSKMDVWSKEMRVRYPQYQEIIDQQLTRVMGRTPANLEMDSVRQQYADEQSATSASASKDETFLSQHVEFLTPEENIQFMKAEPGSQERQVLKAKALLLKGDRTNLEWGWKQLEQNAKAGATEAGPVVSQLVSNIQRQVYLGAVGKGGGTLANLRQTIEQMREGGFSPEEMNQINSMVEEAKASIDQAWVAGTTTAGENGKALSDYFASDPTAWNAQKAKIDEMKSSLDSLLSGKAGVFEWGATKQTALTHMGMDKVEQALGADFVAGMKGIESLVGRDNMYLIYQNVLKDGKDPISEYMTGLIVGKAVSTGDLGSAITTAAQAADPAYKAQVNQSARGAVEALYKTAFDSNLPLEGRRKAAQTLLGDKDNVYFRSLKDTPDNTGLSSREKMYKRFISPEFAQTMKDLGLTKEYTEKLKTYGVALMSGNVEQVNETNQSSKYIDIRFNPNTMKYEATLNRSLVKDPGKVAAYLQARRTGNTHRAFAVVPKDIPVGDLDAIALGMDSIQKLNMINEGLVLAIQNEKPGISAEDLAKELQKYTEDLQASYQKKDPWQTRALKAIGEGIVDAVTGKTATENSKRVEADLRNQRQGEDFAIVPEGSVDFNTLEDSRSSLNDDDAAAILGFVSHAEGADFNTLFGGSKVILEEKTVAEVQQMQRAHGKKTGSSATGAYQVMRKTLSDLIDQGVVDPDEPFTEDVQNRIGMALLQRRGYDDWKAGKITTDEFANRLSQEWAALPNASGKSSYEGKMGNKATVSRTQLVQMLEGLKA